MAVMDKTIVDIYLVYLGLNTSTENLIHCKNDESQLLFYKNYIIELQNIVALLKEIKHK